MKKKFRYPGTKSFSTEEEEVFFGREEDIHNLLTSILVNPTTVLFGYSGTGKSSIIRAGLIPQLYRHFVGDDSGFDNYRIIDINPKSHTEGKQLWAEIRRSLIPQLNLEHPFLPEDATIQPTSLWHLLKKDQYNQELADYQLTTLFIVDQAEELFTYSDRDVDEFVSELHPVIGQFVPESFRRRHPERSSEADSDTLVLSRSKTLHAPLRVKFLFSIRSDKLNLITRLKKASTLILQNSFELLALNRDQAFAGIRRPARKTGDFASEKFTITEAAAEKIFSELCTSDGTTFFNPEECRIDPFSLQIICSFIEQQLVIEKGIREVTGSHLGDIKAIINGYYEDAINSLTYTDRPLTDAERDKVRDFLELQMIVDNRRIPIADVIILSNTQYAITRELLDQLVEKRILKVDNIPGGHMYEITHDSFIRPILEARARRLTTQQAATDKLPQSSVDDLLKDIQDRWASYRKKEARTNLLSTIKKDQPGKKAEITEMMPPPSARSDMELYSIYKKLGEAYIVNKDYSNAIKWLSLAAEIPQANDSTFLVEIYKNRSNAYFYQKNFEASTEDLKKVLRLLPGDRQAIGYLIENYDLQDKFSEGIAWLDKEQVITSENIGVVTNMGFKLIDAGNYEKATQYLQATLSRLPADYDASRGMGMVESFLKHPEPAKAWFENAFAADPQNPEPYSDIGYMYYINGDLDNAIEWYQKSLVIKPDFADSIVGLSRAYYDKGDKEGNREYLKLAHEAYLKLSSGTITIENYHYNLGLLEEALGDLDQAAENYSKAIVSEPAFEDAHTRLTDLLLLQKQAGMLEQLYRGLMTQKPESAKFYQVYLGLAFEKQRRSEEAIELYRQAIAIDPAYVHPHYRLGDIYRYQDQPEAAIEEYRKAMELEPANSYFPCVLGYVYRYLGNYDESIFCFNQAIKLSPDIGWYYVGLGGVYFRKADFEQAAQIFETALKQTDANWLARASLAACYREMNRQKECEEHIARLRQQQAEAPATYISTYDRSCVEALCGNIEESLTLLKRALDNKEIWQRYAQRDSDFYLLQNHPGFKALVGLA